MSPGEIRDAARALLQLPAELRRLREDLNAMILEREMLRGVIATLAQARLVRASVLVLAPNDWPDCDAGGFAARTYLMKPGERRREWLPFSRPVGRGAYVLALGAELSHVQVGDRLQSIDPPGPEHGAQVARLTDAITVGIQLGFELHAPEGS